MNALIPILALAVLSNTNAADVHVKLPGSELATAASNMAAFVENTALGRFPFPLGLAGESYRDLLPEAEIEVVATVGEVVPIGITHLDQWYLGSGSPVIWYRVKCCVKSVARGNFRASSISFVTCCGTGREVWPYVKGYYYRCGLNRRNGFFHLSAQVRTCPLAPHRIDDHASYSDVKSGVRKGSVDLMWCEGLIEEIYRAEGVYPTDVSIEKDQYLLVTILGQRLLGGLDADYTRDVRVRVYSILDRREMDPAVVLEEWRRTNAVPPLANPK